MVYGCLVCRERSETAAVSRGTSHVTTKQRCKYITWVDIQNALKKKKGYCPSFRMTFDKRAISLLESGE